MFTSLPHDNSYLSHNNNYNYNSHNTLLSKDLNDNSIFLNEDHYECNSLSTVHFLKYYEEVSSLMKSNSRYYFNDNIKELEKENLPDFNSISFIRLFLNR